MINIPLYRPYTLALLALAFLLPLRDVRAVDSYLTNRTSTSAVALDVAGNWGGGVVPGISDSVRITNRITQTYSLGSDLVTANASFDSLFGKSSDSTLYKTNALVGWTWTVTNTLAVGTFAGSTNTLVFTSGTLAVTNGDRSAAVIVGQGGVGGLTMNGGALKADSLLSSNNPPGAANSTLTLNAGTIETYRGSVVVQTNASTFSWGTATGGSMNWTMLGGTNLLDGGQAAGTYFQNGTIAVSGSGTVWTNARTLYLGRGGSALGTRLVVSNGATAFNTTTYLNENCTNVSVLVADKGAWYVGQLRFANASTASNTELVISNGGAVYSIGVGELSLGYSGGGTRMVVTGKDSIYSNTIAGGVVQFGKDGGGNTLSVLDGGTFSTLQHFDVGYAAASTGNVLTVSGSNSLLQIAGNFFQRLGGGAVTVSNGGALVVGGNFSLGTNGTAGTVGGGSGLSALVEDGGVLQANTILMGYGGTGILTNFGGIFRFTTGSPTITMNTPGMIVVTNGMVEFAGVTNAALVGEITKFTYQGTNTLALNSATNTIVANYTVQGGSNFSTLDLKGAGSLFRSTNTFSIGIGGSLVGAGVIQSLVVSNAGTIAPGHSPGTLTFSSNLTLLDSSVLVVEINSTNAGDYDRLVVGGAMMRAGTLMITNIGSWSFAVSNRFDLFDYASWSGGFSVTNLPTLDGGLKWDFTDFESQGVLTVALALPIPEPSPFLAMGAGLALLAVLRRRA